MTLKLLIVSYALMAFTGSAFPRSIPRSAADPRAPRATSTDGFGSVSLRPSSRDGHSPRCVTACPQADSWYVHQVDWTIAAVALSAVTVILAVAGIVWRAGRNLVTRADLGAISSPWQNSPLYRNWPAAAQKRLGSGQIRAISTAVRTRYRPTPLLSRAARLSATGCWEIPPDQRYRNVNLTTPEESCRDDSVSLTEEDIPF